MDPADLRLLDAVVALGSFTAAADRAGYTQSAVSRRIAALERTAGMPLFQRAARGVRLTAAGEELHRHARTVLRALDDAAAAMAAVRAGTAGPLRVGAVPTANAALVPRALARLEAEQHVERLADEQLAERLADEQHAERLADEQHAERPVGLPCIDVRLREGGSIGLANAVSDGDLDLAVVFAVPVRDVPGVAVVDLVTDPLLVALPRGHRLCAARELRLADLAGERWVQGAPDVADELFAAADPVPERMFRVREWTAKQGFVAAGLGLTVIPSLAADGVRPDVELRPLRGAGSARRVAAVVPPSPTAATARLLDHLHAVAAAITASRTTLS